MRVFARPNSSLKLYGVSPTLSSLLTLTERVATWETASLYLSELTLPPISKYRRGAGAQYQQATEDLRKRQVDAENDAAQAQFEAKKENDLKMAQSNFALAVAQGIAAVFQCCRLELVSGWCGYPRFLVDLFLELVMVLLLLLVQKMNLMQLHFTKRYYLKFSL